MKSHHDRHLSTTSGGKAWRQLSLSAKGDGYPALHDSHSFVGATSMGFIDYDMATSRKNSTISDSEYSQLFSTSTISCTERAEGEHMNKGHIVLRFDFPDGVTDAEGLQHLEERLRVTSRAVFVISNEMLLNHPSLDTGSSCATLLPSTDPYFAILDHKIVTSPQESYVELHLSPTMPAHAFDYLSVQLKVCLCVVYLMRRYTATLTPRPLPPPPNPDK